MSTSKEYPFILSKISLLFLDPDGKTATRERIMYSCMIVTSSNPRRS